LIANGKIEKDRHFIYTKRYRRAYILAARVRARAMHRAAVGTAAVVALAFHASEWQTRYRLRILSGQ